MSLSLGLKYDAADLELFHQMLEERQEYYNWEEQEYSENRLYYEYDLEHLDELPTKGKMRND